MSASPSFSLPPFLHFHHLSLPPLSRQHHQPLLPQKQSWPPVCLTSSLWAGTCPLAPKGRCTHTHTHTNNVAVSEVFINDSFQTDADIRESGHQPQEMGSLWACCPPGERWWVHCPGWSSCAGPWLPAAPHYNGSPRRGSQGNLMAGRRHRELRPRQLTYTECCWIFYDTQY